MRDAGAGSDFVGAVSDRTGVGVEAAGAGAGVEADLVGAAGMGAEDDEPDRVSKSTTLGRASLPPNQSELERAGSIELAGGKMLNVSGGFVEEGFVWTYSDWKLSAFRGTIKDKASMDPPASLYPRAISF